MKNAPYSIIILLAILLQPVFAQPVIIDHECTDLSRISASYLQQARSQYRIAYGHTSHGSQIISGMQVLSQMDPDLFGFNTDGSNGCLSIRDRIPSGDLGASGDTSWAERTREYLNGAGADRNMVMWSWCGGCSANTVEGIDAYLQAMTHLEQDYPQITFVYMTGHLDGTGEEGNLHKRNEQIRAYCRTNGKVLFDFADIESYDPDGNYFLDKYADDGCNYDGPNGAQHNWAEEWCEAHPNDCPSCSCAHSRSLNCFEKAKAFWWMMARLAGWDGVTGPIVVCHFPPESFTVYAVPNPNNGNATVVVDIAIRGMVEVSLWNILGERVGTLLPEQSLEAATYRYALPAGLVPGSYILAVKVDGQYSTRRVVVR